MAGLGFGIANRLIFRRPSLAEVKDRMSDTMCATPHTTGLLWHEKVTSLVDSAFLRVKYSTQDLWFRESTVSVMSNVLVQVPTIKQLAS
jgi:hypothetical protein